MISIELECWCLLSLFLLAYYKRVGFKIMLYPETMSADF